MHRTVSENRACGCMRADTFSLDSAMNMPRKEDRTSSSPLITQQWEKARRHDSPRSMNVISRSCPFFLTT